ncbi:MAG: DUF4388 domain-containing protein [Myxococcota bacterium]|nr:DUF4388 domain-containing protein [Myxococcota bacterium]
MAEGKLDAFKLFKVFRSVIQRKSSGMLYLTDNKVALSVRLANGHPVHVASDQPNFDLGEALVHEGLLSSTELVEQNERLQSTKESLIATILDEGLVARRRLQRIEGRLSRLRLLPAFSWADGWFRFSDAALYDEPLIQPIDSVSLIIESTASVLPTPLCERFLRGFANQTLKPTDWFEQYGAEFDRFFQPPNLTRRVRTGLSTNEILSMPGNRPQNVRQGCALILGGLCQLVADTEKASQRPARTQVRPGAEPSSRVTRPPKAGIRQRTAPRREPGVAEREEQGRSAERVQTIITAPPSSIPPPKPRTAPRSAPPTASAGEPSKPAQRPRPPRAKRRSVSTPPRTAPSASARVSKSKAATGEVELPDNMKPKDQERLEYIIQLAQTLDTKNHYELLELGKNASAKSIRAAFKARARDYHVDRFSRYGLNEKTLETVQKVFIAFNRAHETLSDAHLRQEYDIGLQLQASGKPKRTGGTTTGEDQLQDVLKAEKLTEAAVALLSRGQSGPALEKLREALQVTPEDPLGLAALAYAEYLQARAHGNSQVVTAKSRGTLKQITKANPGLAEPHLYLGRLHRDAEDFDAAIQSFHKALEQNPHLTEAASELRHTRRKSAPANKGLKGLFGRKK